jgi:hypothetical protein
MKEALGTVKLHTTVFMANFLVKTTWSVNVYQWKWCDVPCILNINIRGISVIAFTLQWIGQLHYKSSSDTLMYQEIPASVEGRPSAVLPMRKFNVVSR